ncbi:fatty acid oxidation complex subunit alpha FadB [Pleionea sp. CnH1-48]|uniref:fatty acid oxidation complex subunit alpha FadB n=1 Tax=Pleionea sp. CnH1-48 TaxID=2954494 RepID=UPI002097F4B4|nr:fatty acid oxidation complex subunit alpha FadB [Pleionea sp. CnH1-48]MCO7227054.1 fatty acid oxidation complex subunit alpha FadB [Pleionea sp. CnH1-48]
MIFEGQSLTCQLLEDGIAEVCFNNQAESVNKFDQNTLAELSSINEALQGNSDVKGAIVTSGKPVFIVGADITEFLGLFAHTREELLDWTAKANAVFNAFEDLPFPTVAAINGIALGGGMEMVLSCDLRVASNDAAVGLPETKLGLIPGFGGTTRLPRVIGADNAIEWIATAKQFKPQDALKVGAIDALVEADVLRDAAIQMAKDAAAGQINWQARREQKKAPLKLNKLESAMAFTTAKGMVGAKAGPHYPAPMEAIRVVEESARLSRDEALKIEHEGFVNVAQTPVASSLIQIFLNDQLLKKKAKIAAKSSSKAIKSSAVLGAGIMGGGIAYQSASKGIPAVMKDINDPALELGMSEATKLLNKGVERGKLTTAKMAKVISSIKPTLSYHDVEGVDVVVEAVVENPKVKDSVLQEVEGIIAEDAILTSNTSTISIDLLAKNLKRPEKFCGMHFFNPVHKMPLVEVIRGEKTSDDTVAAVVAYASAIGKSPIVVRDCPGFFVNRVLFPYFRAFSQLLQDGADFRQVDKVMERFGWPMGPSYLLDVVGIDTAAHCVGVMAEGFPERMSPLANDPVELLYKADRYGQKSGSGFFAYTKDKKGRPKKDVDPAIFDIIGQPSKEMDPQDISDRMMLPMLFEVIRCMEEGIVETAAEADMGLVYGLGFPPFRGGALKYADELGAAKLVELAEKYAHLGAAYTAPESLKANAAEGKTFYSA